MAASKAKYQDIDNINSVVSLIGQPIEDRPNATAGPIRVPRELLSSLSYCIQCTNKDLKKKNCIIQNCNIHISVII